MDWIWYVADQVRDMVLRGGSVGDGSEGFGSD
jgi:hypothetical protein